MDDFEQRISRIPTCWTVLLQAHGGGDGARAAQDELLRRYYGAACRYLLGGFEIHGVAAYLVAAVGIELPTVVWWLAVQLLLAKGFDERFIDSPFVLRLVWIAAVFALALAVPIALATSAPGLAVAAWISSLQITGAATFVGACAITSLLTIGLRQSRPLRFARAFLKGDPELRRSPVRSPYAP